MNYIVLATPVNPDPSPAIDVTVTAPKVVIPAFKLPVTLANTSNNSESVDIPDTFNSTVFTVAVSTPTLVKFVPSPTNDVAVHLRFQV